MWYSAIFQFLAPFVASLLGVWLGLRCARRKVLTEKLAEGAVMKFFEFADTRARLRQLIEERNRTGAPSCAWSASDGAKALSDLRRIARQIAIAAPEYGRPALEAVDSLERVIVEIGSDGIRDANGALAAADQAYSELETRIGKLTCV